MPTLLLPRFRSDLVISKQESASGNIYVIKDPRIGRFVRFRDAEYFIAQQLDGETSLEEIRIRGEKHFAAPLSQTSLEQFAQKLLTLGFLETTDAPRNKVESRRSRFGGNLFYLRFKVYDPDQFFERVVPKIWFLFTRPFAFLSVAVILLAAGVTITSWPELHHSWARLYQPGALFLAWVTFIAIIIGHEFAHGMTCKRYGGKVHEVGMLLVYLQPAMYCNVSDAWLFPEKRKRLLVTLAGAWFEVFCWGLAVLLWRVTDPATMLNFLALVISTTLGIKSLFNLNPLIKLDGYYLLSDLLEIPNLRRNAYSHIGNCLCRLWSRRQKVPETTRRERRIYWLYGVLATVYSTWLMSFLLIGFGMFLTRRYQSWGFIGFTAIVVILFRHSLRRFGRFAASLLAVSRGMLALMKRLIRMAAVLGIAAACLYFVKAELKVSGEFRILPIHNADVRADVEGIVEEIYHDEGDLLQPGDLIARLSDRDYRAELDKVKAEIAEKEAQLRLLKAGARAEEIELARTTVVKGEERLKYSQAYLSMEKTLFEDKLSSKKDYEVAEELVSLRSKELEESKGNLKLLLAGSRPETIEATQAEVTRLATQQRYLEEQLQRLRIVSPIAGVVTTHRLKEKLGANLKKGDLVTEVHDLNSVTAEISVPEKEISDVKLGQSVVLKARAHLRESFRGKVISISPVASKPAEGLLQHEFLVTTILDNADLSLKPEMTGNAKIYCGTKRLYEIVFRRLIRFVRVEFWSWW
jgi:putative peptide zinc metalloprotease protein